MEERFCPSCGYEGTDSICPVCHGRMESLEEEIRKIAQKESEKDNDFLGDVSLEEERLKESEERSEDGESED